MSGLQIIVGSQPDERRTFVIGTLLIFGLSLAMNPQFCAEGLALMRPLLESPLTFATMLAVIVNQLLSLGQQRETVSGA